MRPKATLLIPTMNRPDFLRRLLRFYADRGFRHRLAVGDSSMGEVARAVQEVIRSVEGRLDVVHASYPGLPEPACTARLLAGVTTPFVAQLPDDDFILPHGLDAAIRFLETARDHTVALGRGILVQLDRSGPWGRVRAVGSYRLLGNEAQDPFARLEDHLARYCNTNFGVHRTEDFRRCYAAVPRLPDKGFTEILPNCMACVLGKVKRLNVLYLVRQGHDRRYLLPDTFDWISRPEWAEAYTVVAGILADTLRGFVDLDGTVVRTRVKRAFWRYMAAQLQDKFRARYGGDSPAARIRRRLRRGVAPWIPGREDRRALRDVFRAMRSLEGSPGEGTAAEAGNGLEEAWGRGY